MWFQGIKDDNNFFINPDRIVSAIEDKYPVVTQENSDNDDYSQAELHPYLGLGFRSWRIYSETDIELIRNHLIYRSPVFGIFEEFIPEKSHYLYPIVREEEYWKPGVNYSQCHNHITHHDSPAANCHCGFNAFNKLKDAEEYERYDFDFNRFVFGSIAGWGKMQLHENGWRSEFSAILALLLPETNKFGWNIKPHVESIADFYQVPVFKNKKKFEDYSKRYAKPL